MGFRRSKATKGGSGKAEYRSRDYDATVAYYERHYHNKPPSDFSKAQLMKKQKLRDWITAQADLPRRHKLVNGMLPPDAHEIMRKRFMQPK